MISLCSLCPLWLLLINLALRLFFADYEVTDD
jgi:hypothetical protein